jgi:ABC-type transport system involved in multi-copper enzyme maturation permease subunit
MTSLANRRLFNRPPLSIHNPILWQEATHFRRTARAWRRWELPLGVLVVGVIVGMMWHYVNDGRGYPALQYAIPAIWIVHGIVALRALIAGVNVFSREHVGQTWDALVLTGVSARRILLGKLVATLRTVLPWLLLLATMRMAMLPLMSLSLTQTYAYVTCARSSYGCDEYYPSIDWVPWAWFSSVGLTLAATVLEVMACVALGLATSAITRRPISAAVFAIIVRFIPVALFATFARQSLGNTYFWRYWTFWPFTIADGGTVGLMEMAFPLIRWTQGEHMEVLPGVLGAIGMLALLLVGSLVVTLRAIRREGALAHTPERTPNLSVYRVAR